MCMLTPLSRLCAAGYSIATHCWPVLWAAVILMLAAPPASAHSLDLMATVTDLRPRGATVDMAPIEGAAPASGLTEALHVTISNDGNGQERYPGADLVFAEGEGPNLDSLTALRCWVRVTSNSPEVTSKDLSIVVYQRGSDKQQYHRRSVPVGKWMRIADDISGYDRSDVARISLCMYESQLQLADTYTWEVAGMEAARVMRLDGGSMPLLEAPAYGTDPQSFTTEGLTLNLASNAASVEMQGKTLGGRRDSYSGFLVRDCAANTAWLRPAELEAIGLRLSWEVEQVNNSCLSITGLIEDLTGQDRAVSVAFALPVAPDDLIWWDDVRNKRSVEPGTEYENLRGNGAGVRQKHSFYPLAVISKGDRGLALATRLDEPTVSRMLYDSTAERFSISFDLGLAADCARFPSRAPFRFFLFDAGGDFRVASARYASLFPEFFVKRTMKEGIWMPFTDIATVEDPDDFGFMFQEGAPNVAFDDELGVYSFPYVEPQSWWMPMPKEVPRTYEDAMKYVETYKAGDNQFHRDCARALAAGGIKRPDGTFYLSLRNTPWCDGAQFTYNTDPELPAEEGARNRAHINYEPGSAEVRFGPRGQQHRLQPMPGTDGMYLDSIEGWGNYVNCNRAHFDYVDTPLTFDYESKHPGILQWFSTWEFVKWIAEDLHSRGRLLMANWVYRARDGDRLATGWEVSAR